MLVSESGSNEAPFKHILVSVGERRYKVKIEHPETSTSKQIVCRPQRGILNRIETWTGSNLTGTTVHTAVYRRRALRNLKNKQASQLGLPRLQQTLRRRFNLLICCLLSTYLNVHIILVSQPTTVLYHD